MERRDTQTHRQTDPYIELRYAQLNILLMSPHKIFGYFQSFFCREGRRASRNRNTQNKNINFTSPLAVGISPLVVLHHLLLQKFPLWLGPGTRAVPVGVWTAVDAGVCRRGPAVRARDRRPAPALGLPPAGLHPGSCLHTLIRQGYLLSEGWSRSDTSSARYRCVGLAGSEPS